MNQHTLDIGSGRSPSHEHRVVRFKKASVLMASDQTWPQHMTTRPWLSMPLDVGKTYSNPSLPKLIYVMHMSEATAVNALFAGEAARPTLAVR